jgi:hypothetical protein
MRGRQGRKGGDCGGRIRETNQQRFRHFSYYSLRRDCKITLSRPVKIHLIEIDKT